MGERYCQVDCEQNACEAGGLQHVGSIVCNHSLMVLKDMCFGHPAFQNRFGYRVTYVLDKTEQ